MKKVILSALLGLAIVVSCEKKQEEHTEHVTTEQTDDHAEHSEVAKSDDHDEDAKLELNNGAKWTMNAEMTPHLAEMESQLKAYKPATDDYKTLGENLSSANDQLIKSCTIKGKPHDVLHAWLSPHMKKIDQLKKAKSRDEANDLVADLRESMEDYREYFN